MKVSKCDKKKIDLICYVFRHVPLLQTMTHTLPIFSLFNHEQGFLKQLLGLKILSEEIMSISKENEDYFQRCIGDAL